jgi:hypothetical protein
MDVDVEEFYVPDVLEEASASTKWCLRNQNNDTRNNWKYVFTQWQTEKRIKGKDENVMMASYFKNVGAASAWS